MDFNQLAKELFESMVTFSKCMRNLGFNEGIQGECLLLGFIYKRQCEVAPTLISEELCMTLPRVVAVLNSLEKKGYIERKTDKDDRRRVFVRITDEGRLVAERQRERMVTQMAKNFEMLGQEDAQEYVRILKKLIFCMQNGENHS